MDNIADSALRFLLGNLKELIRYNSDLIGGVSRNVEELCKDLEMLKAVINDYAQKQNNNKFLEELVNEIRTVAYETEDAIDAYMVRASMRKRRSSIGRAFHVFDDASELRRSELQIKKVTKYVHEIYKNMEPHEITTLQLDEISSRSREREKHIVLVEEDNVVGFEDVSEEVIELLTRESEQVVVISIIGMFGLGKTTLAKKILSDPKVEYEFFVRAFVHVSREYTRRQVFLRILNAITSSTEYMRNMSDDQLVQVILEKLESTKYLIVMDDVWSREAWDDLKIVFPNNNKHSRVVITSQNKSVAVHASAVIGPYYLRFLYPEESRQLLRRRVFGENKCPAELEEYELRILQRCGGLPLAIVVIAGILVNQKDRIDWWRKVSEGVNNFLARDKSQMINVIKMSYNDLSTYLKPCFLYMGVFREDFDIPVWKLLQLWIAEGFVERDNDISLEDMAEDYLKELVDKNLVVVGRRRWDGRIKTCRLHDTLRDFCKMEAMKENFFQEIKSSDKVNFTSGNSSLENCRRLCINDSVIDYMSSKPSGMRVRSVLCFAKEETTLPIAYDSFIPKAFKLLRVLDIRSIILTRFPLDLIQLILLKYIAICGTFMILPGKMSNLCNLQTLIVDTSSLTLDIKANIWKMTQLRHLLTNASTELMQKFKDEPLFNANLQTLSTISPESCRKEVLERTPMLKKLGIRGKLADLFYASGQSSLFDSLLKLEELENLKLLNSDQSFKLRALPPPSTFPRKLRKLTLLNTSLDWEYMSTLGKLERLEVLKLKDNAFKGSFWQTEDGGFRNLRVLHIGSTDLMVWEASASHFPVLRSLLVRHCTKLEALPPCLIDISTLQEIDLYFTSSKLATSAREIQALKLEVPGQQKSTKPSGFKLSVYPHYE